MDDWTRSLMMRDMMSTCLNCCCCTAWYTAPCSCLISLWRIINEAGCHGKPETCMTDVHDWRRDNRNALHQSPKTTNNKQQQHSIWMMAACESNTIHAIYDIMAWLGIRMKHAYDTSHTYEARLWYHDMTNHTCGTAPRGRPDLARCALHPWWETTGNISTEVVILIALQGEVKPN